MRDAVTLWREVLDDVEARDARGVRSLVVVQPNGDGTASVTDGNPEHSTPWTIPLAHALAVLPGDRLLAITVSGREIGALILRRPT